MFDYSQQFRWPRPCEIHRDNTTTDDRHAPARPRRTLERSNARKMWRRVYFLLILVRVYFALSPSYLHPDENFQGPEVIAGMSCIRAHSAATPPNKRFQDASLATPSTKHGSSHP